MAKSKVKAQLRKIATREAIEKRKNGKPVDPFAFLLANNKRHAHTTRDTYNKEEEQDYGF